MTTDNKMPAARTNPVKQAVIIAVVMVKVKRGERLSFLKNYNRVRGLVRRRYR